MDEKISVLVVFANPRDTNPLNLGREDKVIREAIQLSKYRENIEIDIFHAATIHDLRRALLNKSYKIVHISGHGTGSGLVLEDELGGKFVVPQKGLANLFEAYSSPRGNLECVLLNACYSVSQGKIVSLETPFTIAMEGAISDVAAVEFSRGFYDGIGARKSIDFAYGEGCRTVELTFPNHRFVSKIIKKGEVLTPSYEFEEEMKDRSRNIELSESSPKSLVGLAIDVSGSMSQNIRNNTNYQLSRLEGFNESLKQFSREANKTIEENRRRNINCEIDVFAYAFGLKSGDICDLLSLLKVGRDIISNEELEAMKKRYINELQTNYGSYSGLGNLAREFGFGDLVNSAEQTLKRNAEQEVKRKIMKEVGDRLFRVLESAGDTTLSMHEVSILSNSSSQTLEGAEELIYGNTPMQKALKEILARFKRELLKRSSNTNSVLFIISDGEPTDGNPIPYVNEIKKLGITIITCYVTSKDIASPKVLEGNKKETWDYGAQLMFEIASEIDVNSSFSNFLLRKGWTIQQNAKLFVQINHSSVLEEFINVVLSPLKERLSDSLPSGV